MTIIRDVSWLQDKINVGEQIQIVDVRPLSKKGKKAEELFVEEHIEQAVYINPKNDLTGKDSFFPSLDQVKSVLETKGIVNEIPIVLYDDGDYRSASKAYVLLSYIGHEQIYILDGGWKAWKEKGFKTVSGMKDTPPSVYRMNVNESVLVEMKEVKEQLNEANSIHIDSRVEEKYTGIMPSGYGKSGHIKGAINLPAKDVVQADGRFKDQSTLQKHFTSIENKEEYIVSCGSGNSACINVVALKEAGFTDVRLYPGGFQEWSKHEDNDIE